MPRIAALARLFGLSRPTFALLVACGLCGQVSQAAAADTVWRCEAANGAAMAYQATPCRDGGRALPKGPAPSIEDRETSARVAKREAGLARSMGRQRIQREKDLPAAAHASLSGPVRQVSVGQREEDRIKARKRSQHQDSIQGTSRARQRRHDVFRAEVPGRPRQRSGKAQAEVASASPP